MPSPVALVIHGTDPACDQPHSRGRVVHALKTAAELRDAGIEVQLRFEGAGVVWLKRFHLRDDKFTQHYGGAFDEVKDLITGTCDFCTRVRFGVTEHAEALGVPLVGGERQHGTVAPLIAEGWQVLVF